MTIRKRIQVVTKRSVTGGTEIAPAPGGAIQWSPASGRSDGTQFEAKATVSLGPISIGGDVRARGGITLPAISTQFNTAGRAAIGLPTIATDMGVTARGQVRLNYTASNVQPKHDFYIDENAPTSNFGTAQNLLAKTNAAVGNNRQFTIIAWDFTGVSGTVTDARVNLRISTSLVTGETATYQVWTSPTQPYTESTANWNNSNAPVGTQRGTLTQAVTNSATAYTLLFDATQRANLPGNWLYLRCLGTSAVGAATITTVSKEGSSPPIATFTVDV